MRSMPAAALTALLLSPRVHAGDAQEGVCRSDSPKGVCIEEDLTGNHIVEEIHKQCPLFNTHLGLALLPVLRGVTRQTSLLQSLGLYPSQISPEGWADEYTTMIYLFAGRLALSFYKTRDKSYVRIPTAMSDPADFVHVENVYAPHFDPDGTPNFLWFESAVPQVLLNHFYTPLLTCFYSLVRRLDVDGEAYAGVFADDIDDPEQNTWDIVLAKSGFKSKRAWVNAFYDANAKTWDGNSLWPTQMTNFQNYFRNDEWNDGLEQAWAFNLIASHRVETGSWSFDNVNVNDLPFRIRLNNFSALEVRPGFGKYGGDMYFNADGLPVLLETPTGEIVLRGDKSWQYWKFAWRSSLITCITLVDHLHFTHFRSSNLLARVVRVALPPEHPFRRLLSIFSFGAIFVNLQAMHTLVGSNHMLHRATPFKNFEDLSKMVPDGSSGIMEDVQDKPGIRELLDDDAFEKLHPKLQEAPYFADGRLLMKAIQKLVKGVTYNAMHLVCDVNGDFTPVFRRTMSEWVNETKQAHYAMPDLYKDSDAKCTDIAELFFKRLAAFMFIVTGWHRHVGFVGDYYLDPSLATMSWKDGEMFGRPRQHIIMTVINVFTSTHQPLLKEDYTHLFKGMSPNLDSEFTTLWKTFLQDLNGLDKEIVKRNKEREIVNYNMHPSVLESAVSK
eukprot:TRINITY_DN95222_c0_g1_i1.p1 TRINITY_DN95222_c0_g1~~TRINITY_DN95222_c0_g1_i1.p1  ORF type:complete len:669 (+),score=133.67 TRINITY_DN95222_c0_g1_i1:67-2073(+)